MLAIAKKKKTQTDYHKYPAWGIRIPTVYRNQLKELVKKTRRREVEEVKIALEEYLAKHGLWLPSNHK